MANEQKKGLHLIGICKLKQPCTTKHQNRKNILNVEIVKCFSSTCRHLEFHVLLLSVANMYTGSVKVEKMNICNPVILHLILKNGVTPKAWWHERAP